MAEVRTKKQCKIDTALERFQNSLIRLERNVAGLELAEKSGDEEMIANYKLGVIASRRDAEELLEAYKKLMG